MCDELKSIEETCNLNCRNSAWQAVMKSSGLTVTDPGTGESYEIDIEGGDGYFGEIET